MSEPRKDVKVMLDPEVHAALKVICARKDVGLGAYIESIVAPHVLAYVHDVTVMADEFRRSGISRDGQEWRGKPMSDGYYLPQPGTIAARAVDLLHHARAGAELSSSALAEALDVDHTSITPCLRSAVRHGALRVEKRLNVNYWTLGDGTAVPLEADDDPPLQIVRSASAALAASRSTAPRVAVWGDGRLVVERGAQRLEFSPAETREIVAYLASFAQAGEGC